MREALDDFLFVEHAQAALGVPGNVLRVVRERQVVFELGGARRGDLEHVFDRVFGEGGTRLLFWT